MEIDLIRRRLTELQTEYEKATKMQDAASRQMLVINGAILLAQELLAKGDEPSQDIEGN